MMKRLGILVVALMLCFSMSGCAAVVLGGAAAGGTYVYVAGQAKQQFNASLDRTYQAAIAACGKLNLRIEKKEKKLSDASITAKDSDTTVMIDIERKSSNISEVSVRYGILGDEQSSSQILSAIKNSL
ncbi:DUF3568 family protein [Maridesulfovibrio bastinii]|jgi:archaellum component FlaF (FlaF/FlaG flagellin family)|uniref:DUF3568 family protein n=1 Tax=Maridesulfovibrio bastinii TaxID=47157 RepID=UPI0003F7D5E4|nr:DUF3568 family protein [Maridesulfovibrio bastinii]